MRYRQSLYRAFALGVVTLGGLLATGLPARAQEEDIRRLREAFVGPTYTQVAMPAEFLCAKGDNFVFVSPDGKDAIVRSTTVSVPRSIETLLEEHGWCGTDDPDDTLRPSQLLLLSQGDDHAQVIWRGGGRRTTGSQSVSNITWLPGTRTALASVYVKPARLLPKELKAGATSGRDKQEEFPPTLSIVLINSATGMTQTIAENLDFSTSLIVAPTKPVAVLVDDAAGTIRRIEASGKLGPRIRFNKPKDAKKSLTWHRLLTDGHTLEGTEQYSSYEGTVDTRPKPVVYHFDTLTGTTAVATTTEKEKEDLGGARTAFVVQRGKGSLIYSSGTREVYPLWLESRDRSMSGQTLIASDSDVTFTPVVLPSAVLYQHGGAMYRVPILKTSTPEFLQRRSQKQLSEAMMRATLISGALKQYAADHGNALPSPGSDMVRLLKPYSENSDIFQNPVTGTYGFTPLYEGEFLVKGDGAASARLVSLRGPGGCIIVYADGHIGYEGESATP